MPLSIPLLAAPEPPRPLRSHREVKESVEAFKRDFAQFEALQNDGQPDEIAHAQKELLSQLKTLNWCAADRHHVACASACCQPTRLGFIRSAAVIAGIWTTSATQLVWWKKTVPSTHWMMLNSQDASVLSRTHARQ